MRLVDRNAQTNRWRQTAALEKVVFSFGAIVLALCSASWIVQMSIIVILLTTMRLGAGIPLRDIGLAASVPVGFILAGTIAQVMTVEFASFVPRVGISAAAFAGAGFIALRSLAGVMGLLFLALTTPLTDLLRLLRRTGLSAELGDIALMMFRFVWLTLDCLEGTRRSQANRLGFVDYRRSLRSSGLLLANLLPRVLSRARRLEAGMAARGYTGELRFVVRERPAHVGRLAASAALFFGLGAAGMVLV
ncbi:CbiQ family ECF transporter T component [Dongia sp.]|uniref:CbiQ family ECF transporter T component n=1 Tax=Dongia sp. TaxID=1977262 RepID=UPI0035AF7EFB